MSLLALHDGVFVRVKFINEKVQLGSKLCEGSDHALLPHP